MHMAPRPGARRAKMPPGSMKETPPTKETPLLVKEPMELTRSGLGAASNSPNPDVTTSDEPPVEAFKVLTFDESADSDIAIAPTAPLALPDVGAHADLLCIERSMLEIFYGQVSEAAQTAQGDVLNSAKVPMASFGRVKDVFDQVCRLMSDPMGQRPMTGSCSLARTA